MEKVGITLSNSTFCQLIWSFQYHHIYDKMQLWLEDSHNPARFLKDISTCLIAVHNKDIVKKSVHQSGGIWRLWSLKKIKHQCGKEKQLQQLGAVVFVRFS